MHYALQAGVVDFDDEADEPSATQRGHNQWSKAKGAKAATKKGQKPKVSAPYVPGQLSQTSHEVPAALITVVYGSSTPTDWSAMGLSPAFVEALQQAGFNQPTKVQQAALPQLLAGRDTLVKAPTGSGKTLAYLVPLIHDLQVRHTQHLFVCFNQVNIYIILVCNLREIVYILC